MVKRKILFYQRSDVIGSSGGTEKVMVSLSSAMAEDEYDVTFLVNENKSGKPFFDLSEKVNFINLGGAKFTGFRKFVFKLIKSTPLLRHLKYFDEHYNTSSIVSQKIKEENPDILVLANTGDLLEIAYKQEYKIPIIQMIHGFPRNIFQRRSKTILRLTMNLMKKVNVSQVLLDSYVPLMKHYHEGKIVVIPNSIPAISDNFSIKYNREKDKYIIINVGRVTEIKNQKLIVDAFATLSNKYKNWDVHIWGRDDDRQYFEEIKDMIDDYGLQNRIFLKGITTKMLSQMAESDIFAFPSIHEGFPLALTEAMAIGLPPIGLQDAPGVNEIIKNNQNGLLAKNNRKDFANKLEELMSNVELREKLGKSARESVKQFMPEKVLERWKILIEETINDANKKEN